MQDMHFDDKIAMVLHLASCRHEKIQLLVSCYLLNDFLDRKYVDSGKHHRWFYIQ